MARSQASMSLLGAGFAWCQPERITIENSQTDDQSSVLAGARIQSAWTAAGCDRIFDCTLLITSGGPFMPTPKCTEREASKEATTRKVVTERLALETGCSAEQIKIVQASAWKAGTEQAYRLDACGSPYLCTSAAGRVDCKAAIVPAAAPAAPAVAPAVAPAR